ncbi:major facilitator superfamily domain-containing protein [Scheffersomyces coipomensis]|uniref:major facilitator superfamily domain-containing protein n=1 Tax=Scheffersomyces coipomensis TaxID=1788519 RepID=UPI00315C655C
MDPRPKIFKSLLHEISLVSLVCLAQFLTQGGITMCLSTMNIIIDTFETDEPSLKVWFMSSFALTIGTFILISGKLGDLIGFKTMFITGWIWTCIWSLITGLSIFTKSIVFFIVCRAFQGIGFAMLLPCGIGILGNIYPQNNSRKNLMFGLVGANGPSGAMIGALIGAAIAQTWWWPWLFWLLSIFCAILGVCSIFVIPNNINSETYTVKQIIEKFDFLGSFIGITGLILLNFVLIQGPITGWSSIYIIVLLVLSIFLIIAFFILELNFIKYPLLPRSIFTIKIGLILSCISFGWGSFGVWQYYYWSIILNFRNYTPIEGSLTYTPFLVFGILASMIVSIIISRIRPSLIISFASICFMVGCAMLSIMPIHQSYFGIAMGQMFILCWAMDMSFPAASIILSDYLPIKHQGMAGSLVTTVINYSVSLYLGFSNTVQIEVLNKNGNDVIDSYRKAIYFGIGVAGLGVLSSFVLVYLQKNDDVGTLTQKDVELEIYSTVSNEKDKE